jgi:hypothetical protein
MGVQRSMRRAFYGTVVVAVFLALSACEGGGGNCPWERPSCCDNNLFGCGPFDLPQGCSCGDYFSRSFQGFPVSSKVATVRQTGNTSEGTWRASLTKRGSGCSYLKRQTTATVLIRERNKQVTMKFIGLTTLRGNRVGRNVRSRGRISVPLSRCSADVRSDVALSSPSTGNVTAKVDVTCAAQNLSCSASYSGALKKL